MYSGLTGPTPPRTTSPQLFTVAHLQAPTHLILDFRPGPCLDPPPDPSPPRPSNYPTLTSAVLLHKDSISVQNLIAAKTLHLNLGSPTPSLFPPPQGSSLQPGGSGE